MVWSDFFLVSISAAAEKNPEVPVDKSAREIADTLSRDEDKLPEGVRWLAEYSIFGNEVWRYLLMAGAVALTWVVGRVVRMVLEQASRRFEARRRELLAAVCRALAQASGFFFLVVGLRIGVNFLILTPWAEIKAGQGASVLLTLAVGYVGYCLVTVIDHWLRNLSAGSSRLDEMLVPMMSTSFRLLVGILVLVEVAAIYEQPITPVIAGLGVGGLAIGLAAQDTVKNFFGSLMIFSDRPFELGDEIRVDAIGGTVESVGFRSTRLRTNEGFLVAISNGELANKTIVNVSKRPSLLRQFSLPLSYDLPPEKLERAARIVAELLRDHEGSRAAKPPRVFLGDFTPSAVNLTVSYWYFSTDWWRFLEFNQRTNLEILRRFAAEGIRLAYPTQTIRLEPGATGEGPAAAEPPSPEQA
ncbi:MAG TPA: mechanosensitive ion channel family protein [Pirellulales bacterium]|jgi:MscS family membrane protein|nr:mechanosensitive ion channel family protein [Pirellulales bacterium]